MTPGGRRAGGDQHWTTPHRTTPHWTTPHWTTPHWTTPHWTTLHWTSQDRGVVRRAAWRAAAQAMILVAATFAVAGLLIVWIVFTEQSRSNQQQLTSALQSIDDVTDPPDGIWLVLRSADGTVATSAGAPSILPDRADLAAVAARPGAGPVTRDLRDRHGVQFRVRTVAIDRSGTVAQAALSLAGAEEERERLLTALGLSGLVALAVAGCGGAVTGRRAVSGLVDTTSRQRRFVADAGHELRTPLTVLTTRTQLLARHLRTADLAPGARSLLTGDTDALLADCHRLAELLEDLLVSAEPPSDRWQPAELRAAQPSADLDRVAGDAVAAMQPLADDRDVALVADADDHPRTESVTVRGGEVAVRRCVTALLDNATRHTPPGGTVTVAVRSGTVTGSISVTDTGPGIPPRLRSRLFDRFAHGGDGPESTAGPDSPVGPESTAGPDGDAGLDSNAHPDGSTGLDGGAGPDGGAGSDGTGTGGLAPRPPRRYGLGLALVADTTHRLGGSVEVDTSPQGTTFTIRLPRQR